MEIRKIIYTTNLIANLKGNIRKHTEKMSLQTHNSVLKSIYLTLRKEAKNGQCLLEIKELF
ncbi:hypothetical protein [Flavobacterium limicola]|uniref:hypothetical protein n=1 Tax=Flavobacterium limicola TaxID=180441 RepID=UPI000EB53405